MRAFVDGRQVSPSIWNCLLGGEGRQRREGQEEEQQGIGQKEASQNLQLFSDQSCHAIFGSVRNSLVGAVFVFVSN